ncbi:FAD-dependent oxidoreductase [Oceanidesulfovibrio marinus]|uniref:Pyridine nucleotide-disulfide oxidoreductase n=1 Tax=Oceanidesulfovibrio marinus TaxID=370038 RepID=A0A6P1ZI25_9BACT|nr:FAD-dependent oxidoreductase [Oceanidesulfovibrio marinus]TVM34992.1 pyridine nucleotide-disulfide oxidoreductase [Oceanidesulfovibrio marinus]
MASKRIVVVGGSAAGPKAASRAKRMNQDAEVVLIQRAPELSMASCAYPYFIKGEVAKRDQLLSTPTGVVRNPTFFEGAKGVHAYVETEVESIDRAAKKIVAKNLRDGSTQEIEYDSLILCTGANPRMPPLPGSDLKGITPLHAMKDADFLASVRGNPEIKRAVIIGGGLIGIETSEALQHIGLEVTVVELLPQILMFLDWELALVVENHVRANTVDVIEENGVSEYLGENGAVTGVRLKDGREIPCDLVVVSIGVSPNTELARNAGLTIGETGGIQVDAHMKTSDPSIYAAGDCTEKVNRITGKKCLAPFGDVANLEGRVAGENAAIGDTATFPGVVLSGICKVFNLSAGSTGLSERMARAAGYDVLTATNAGPDKPGFMGGKLVISKMVIERETERVLGFQCIGAGDVNRQVAEAATAVNLGAKLSDLVNLDLPYAPPFSLALDHFLTTAHVAENKLRGLFHGVNCSYVLEASKKEPKPFMLDVRSPDEWEEIRIGIGEILIPLGNLRNRLNELPQDKDAEILCWCKVSMRGYEAERILAAHGWTNIKVMEGGVMAWPFEREK